MSESTSIFESIFKYWKHIDSRELKRRVQKYEFIFTKCIYLLFDVLCFVRRMIFKNDLWSANTEKNQLIKSQKVDHEPEKTLKGEPEGLSLIVVWCARIGALVIHCQHTSYWSLLKSILSHVCSVTLLVLARLRKKHC